MKTQTRYTFVKHGKKSNLLLGYFDALWRAKDHLLLVQNRIYTQSYKRFYFSDIQGLTAQVTNQRNVYTWILGIIILFLLLIVVVTDGPARIFWLGSSVIFSIVFGINWLRGPTCKAMIITKVQSHPLPITRLKDARRVFAHLRQYIEKQQGTLDVAEITKPLNLTREKNEAAPKVKSNSQENDVSNYSGSYHLLFFCFLLIIAFINGVQLYAQHITFVLLEMLIFIASMVAMVLALKNQHSSAMSGLLKTNTWGALILIFILIGISYIDFLVLITEQGGEDLYVDQLNMVIFMAHRDPSEYPFWKFSLYFHAISLSVISILGIVQILIFRSKRNEAA